MQSTAIGRQNKFGPFTKLLRIMKVSALLILIVLQTAARPEASAQVTLKERSASLEKVLKAIKKQSDYGLVFDETLVRSKGKPVSVDVNNVPVETALAQVFKTQDMLTYSLNGKIISIREKKAGLPNSQTSHNGITETPTSLIDVKGKVVNEKGEPLAGVSVLVKGTRRGTSTDDNGVFEIKGLPEDAILQISGVNIESYETKLNGRTELSFTAKAKISRLVDVEISNVSTGYQTIPKERATGSYTQIDNKTLNQQVGSNILNRLESVTNGLAFNKSIGLGGTKPPLTIRGLSTMNGPTAPLIVVDNFPFEGDINSINPNMVESITILKDATAASIWGTRAGNGVIVINTKKGKYNKPLTVEFNSNVQLTVKPDIYYQKPISSTDYIDLEQFLYGKGFYNGQINNSSRPVLSPIVEILDQQSRGVITSSDAASQIASLRKIDFRDQYDKSVFRNAINSQYSLNFSGGSQQMAWSASGGYDRNLSSLDEKYDRITARLENNFKANKNLIISGSIYFTNTNSQSGKTGFPNNLVSYPYTQLFDENGKALPVALAYRKSYLDTLGGGKLLDWNYYPGEDYKHKTSITKQNTLLINFGAQYQIGKGFSFDLKYQYEMQQGQTNNLADIQSYDARYLINSFSQLNWQSGVVTYIVPKGGILDVLNNKMYTNNIREQLNYNKSWGKHQFVGLIGNEVREITNESMTNRTYGYNPETISGVPIDLKNSYPIIATGYTSNIPTTDDFGKTLTRSVSFFGNAAYTYNNKYNLTISARRDASNLFGVSTNNKWKPLWSVGASWDISKETFYKLAFLPSLKFRATYGYTGNSNPKTVGVATLYTPGAATISGLPYSIIQFFPNPELRWEQVGITNFGIDFASRNAAFYGSLEWYQKRATDLIAYSPLDITAGAGPGINKNVANMVGSGIDLILNANLIQSKVKWNAGLIFNYNTDHATRVYLQNQLASNYINDGLVVRPLEGRPIYSVMSFGWAGLDNTGDPQGYLSGKISKDYASILNNSTIDNLEYNGPALPQFFGSITNNLAYKGFELGINISYKLGYYFKRQGLSYYGLFNGMPLTSGTGEDYSKRWQKPGDENTTDVLALTYPSNTNRETFYGNSSVLVEKGDNIRLQFINLSYQFKLKGNVLTAVNRLQVYFNASNLGILWRANKRGLDPDYLVSTIPPSASYALGFRFMFQ